MSQFDPDILGVENEHETGDEAKTHVTVKITKEVTDDIAKTEWTFGMIVLRCRCLLAGRLHFRC